MKRENLNLFVEEARRTMQSLWDQLYYSEDEMLEFEAAFTSEFESSLVTD